MKETGLYLAKRGSYDITSSYLSQKNGTLTSWEVKPYISRNKNKASVDYVNSRSDYNEAGDFGGFGGIMK